MDNTCILLIFFILCELSMLSVITNFFIFDFFILFMASPLNTACVNACPTDTLVFGDFNNPESRVSKLRKKEMDDHHGRGYKMLDELGTSPNVIYLKKVDKEAKDSSTH